MKTAIFGLLTLTALSVVISPVDANDKVNVQGINERVTIEGRGNRYNSRSTIRNSTYTNGRGNAVGNVQEIYRDDYINGRGNRVRSTSTLENRTDTNSRRYRRGGGMQY